MILKIVLLYLIDSLGIFTLYAYEYLLFFNYLNIIYGIILSIQLINYSL